MKGLNNSETRWLRCTQLFPHWVSTLLLVENRVTKFESERTELPTDNHIRYISSKPRSTYVREGGNPVGFR